MFGSLFCLLILSVLASSLIDLPSDLTLMPPFTGFFVGLSGYLLLLGALSLLGKFSTYKTVKKTSFFAQIALLSYFFIAKFFLGSFQLPFFQFSQLITSLLLFSLYFIGLALFYSSYEKKEARQKGLQSIRFLLPFSLPYFFLLTLYDLWNLIPYPLPDLLFGVLAVTCLLLSTLFVPIVIQKSWGCSPLPPSPLADHLEAICRSCAFRHGGFKLWTPMKEAFTAAIIGILPRFRYILFTEKLLKTFPEEELTAILIHEMGHSQRKHLLLYPLILGGMVLSIFAIALFFTPAFYAFFFLRELIFPAQGWQALFPIAYIGGIILFFALYFRLVFGFFSRLFERQADLHIFATNANPRAMTHALHRLAILTGYTQNHPNWHHGTLQSRIDFIDKSIRYPELIAQHHRKVRRCVGTYLCFFILCTALFLAPFANRLPLFRKIEVWTEKSANWFAQKTTTSLRTQAIARIEQDYALQKQHTTVQKVIHHYLLYPSSFDMRASFLFSLAEELFAQRAYAACARVLAAIHPSSFPPELQKRLLDLTKQTRYQMMMQKTQPSQEL